MILHLDNGNLCILVLPDFSPAFYTIDHCIIIHRPHTDLRFNDTVFQWYLSHLTDRTQYVTLSNYCSTFVLVNSDFIVWPYTVLNVHLAYAYHYLFTLTDTDVCFSGQYIQNTSTYAVMYNYYQSLVNCQHVLTKRHQDRNHACHIKK